MTATLEDVLALSPLQQGLYSLTTLSDSDDGDTGEGTGTADPYLIAMAADITGDLDATLLRDCATAMFERHPNLRASFVRAGSTSRVVQVVPSRVDVPWRHVTASPHEVEALEADARRRRFDLGRGPAMRFLLVEMPGPRWRLVIVAHHIVIDGWSLPLFVGELIALYRSGGDATALPAPPRPYRDYIGWLAGRDQEGSRRLWRDHLAGLPGPTLLTPALTDGEPPSGMPRRTEVRLDAAATAALAEAARTRGVTLNTLVQMAWANIVSTFTDRSDVVFGVTVSGRPGELAGVESMVGLFVNTVPLRVRLDPVQRVGAQCVALQREAAALRDHSYLAHAELRSIAGIGEMFDTLLVYENFPPGGLVGSGEFEAAGARFRPAALESLAHFPVTVAAHLTDGELTVLVEVIDGALGAMTPESLGRRVLATAQRLVVCWERPLRDVGVLIEGEAAAQTTQVAPGGAGGVHVRFAEVAGARPDSVAVTWTDGRLTYGELDEAADRLAAALAARGVRTETPVAILLSRGPDYVIAMLGVLKAGGVIVPLDPAMPAGRVDDIVTQSGAALVLDAALLAECTAEPSPGVRPVTAHRGQAAYVVFTSGTTGRPKGVVGTHDAVLAYTEDHARSVLRPAADRLGRTLSVAHAWSFTFDAAWQPLAALLDGHSVHIVDDDVQRDAEALVATIARFGIDLIDTTPSMFAQFRAFGLLSAVPLGVLALGGEAVGIPAWNLIRDECARTGMAAFNCYGPTETTVEAVVAAIADHESPTIGLPTGPTRAYVLDSWLRPLPDGATGELYLAGGQLTRGYLGRMGETSGRFIADPFVAGERMYRTGDVVRRSTDGSLQFLGRSDAQVKIRGFRVEPAEIAAVLHGHPAVRHAHVAVRHHRSGPRLTAYVSAYPEPPVPELRAMLTKRLPRYMVPHRIVLIDELPLTPHGKVDEPALAALAQEPEDEVATPETATEIALAEVLADILQTGRQVDVTADLLQLGLDSIVALSVVQAARRRGVALRARLMLECGTIRELAAAVDGESAGADRGDDEGDGPIPALANVHWLYEHGDPRRLAQTEAIRLPDGITVDHLHTLLRTVVDGHEMLRCRLDRDTMTFVPGAVEDFLTEVSVSGPLVDAVAEHTRTSVERLDPSRGALLSAVWLRDNASAASVLVLSAHVLAMDPASWRIVVGELDAGWHALSEGRQPTPALEHTGYRRWSRLLHERAHRLDTCDFWEAQLAGADPDLGARRVDPRTDRARDLTVSVCVTDAHDTTRLLSADRPMAHLLAAAAADTVTRWRRHRGQDTPPPLLALESFGRVDAVVDGGAGDVDTGETVGLMSAIYPLRIGADVAADLAAVPGDGIDYALLRYLRADTAPRLRAHREPQLLLNYLGRAELGAVTGDMQPDRTLTAGASQLPEPDLAVRYELTLNAVVFSDGAAPVLATQWRTLPDILDPGDVEVLQGFWQEALRKVCEE
ncbi:amino acid adenylation domain-containing protein [Mycobacterium sp. NPDC050551]|uniref:amino acid adenylation domain-containing protein n=1 Tax=Mycobacterium sp. NPDC050551 TaxID=3155407 RepID=UPI0034431C28